MVANYFVLSVSKKTNKKHHNSEPVDFNGWKEIQNIQHLHVHDQIIKNERCIYDVHVHNKNNLSKFSLMSENSKTFITK